jgi:hypothetical protein
MPRFEGIGKRQIVDLQIERRIVINELAALLGAGSERVMVGDFFDRLSTVVILKHLQRDIALCGA